MSSQTVAQNKVSQPPKVDIAGLYSRTAVVLADVSSLLQVDGDTKFYELHLRTGQIKISACVLDVSH